MWVGVSNNSKWLWFFSFGLLGTLISEKSFPPASLTRLSSLKWGPHECHFIRPKRMEWSCGGFKIGLCPNQKVYVKTNFFFDSKEPIPLFLVCDDISIWKWRRRLISLGMDGSSEQNPPWLNRTIFFSPLERL